MKTVENSYTRELTAQEVRTCWNVRDMVHCQDIMASPGHRLWSPNTFMSSFYRAVNVWEIVYQRRIRKKSDSWKPLHGAQVCHILGCFCSVFQFVPAQKFSYKMNMDLNMEFSVVSKETIS